MNTFKMWILGLVASIVMMPAAFAGTLDTVKSQGFFNCGVSQGVPGFSNPDDAGNWTGLDVDFCRAMAAAIFNDPQAVKFTPLSSKQRFTALSSGEIDVLARNTTWTMTRDASLGLNFSVVNYYDGQGMMVPKSLGVTSGTELDGEGTFAEESWERPDTILFLHILFVSVLFHSCW